jgi:hypothetical protein
LNTALSALSPGKTTKQSCRSFRDIPARGIGTKTITKHMSKLLNYIKTSPTRIQFQPAPAGTYLAVITSVEEEFDVTRPKFTTPTETETVDLTTIICAVKDSTGAMHFVATMPMRTSADPKSALVGFINGALGTTPWTTDPNWDSQSLVGTRIQLSVIQQRSTRSGRIFNRITSVAPALPQFADYAPSLAEAQIALQKYREAAAQQGPPRVVAPPAPLPNSAVWPPSAPLAQMPPSSGAAIPTIQPPGTPVSQTNSAPAAGWPVNPASFAPPVFSGKPPVPAMGGQAAPGALPLSPILPPASQSPTVSPAPSASPPPAGQPGVAPFIPTAENPDLKF